VLSKLLFRAFEFGEQLMTPYQQSLYEKLAPARVFAITSWGAAATRWLADILNRCPGLYCAHAQNFSWRTFGGAEVDSVRYLQILGVQGHTARAVGDVHGISRLEIPAISEFFGDKFRAAVVICDPFPRLHSQLALFDRWCHLPVYDTEYLDTVHPQAIRLLPTGSYYERLFVHGANMLNTIIEEIAVGPIFRMEDLTRDPKALVRIVEYVSANDVVPSQSWAEAHVNSEATNRHNLKPPRAFEPWQNSVLKTVIKEEANYLSRARLSSNRQPEPGIKP
jgi:hypothetical protein